MGQGLLAAGATFSTAAPAPAIDAAGARAYLRRCSAIVHRHADALTRLDAALGDGDHGDNLMAGLVAIEADYREHGYPTPEELAAARAQVAEEERLIDEALAAMAAEGYRLPSWARTSGESDTDEDAA